MAGLPSKTGFSDTTLREVAWWLAKGYTKEEAAKRAGLASSARVHQYTRTKAFADEIRSALKDHITTEPSPKAVRIIDEIMSDTATSARVRVDAAKVLLDRAGIIAAPVAPSEDSGKALTEKTTAELHELVAQLQKQIEERRADDMTIEGEAVEIDEMFD
jgi:hypothetical protein